VMLEDWLWAVVRLGAHLPVESTQLAEQPTAKPILVGYGADRATYFSWPMIRNAVVNTESSNDESLSFLDGQIRHVVTSVPFSSESNHCGSTVQLKSPLFRKVAGPIHFDILGFGEASYTRVSRPLNCLYPHKHQGSLLGELLMIYLASGNEN